MRAGTGALRGVSMVDTLHCWYYFHREKEALTHIIALSKFFDEAILGRDTRCCIDFYSRNQS